MKIELSDYDPSWHGQFESEKKLIIKNFPVPNIHIEHIGSTSVKDLKAKPVIDIMLGVLSLEKNFENIIEHLNALGYQYIEKYNLIIPERRYFYKASNEIHTHHLHMVIKDSEFWKRHLFFRDHLRNNRSSKEKYESLKIELAKKEWNDRNDYADAKGEFIRSIEQLR